MLRKLGWMRAARIWPNGQRYFETYRSGDEYDTDAITHVMACCAQLPGDWLRADWEAC